MAPQEIGQKLLGKERNRFSLKLPTKDIIGRAAIYRVKGKEFELLEAPNFSEKCIISDVNTNTGYVTLSFNMFGKSSFSKSVNDIQVLFFFSSYLAYSFSK